MLQTSHSQWDRTGVRLNGILMPIVTIQQFNGRTAEQKQDLARRIAEAVRIVYGKTAQPVQVLYNDMALDDWYSEGVPVRSLPREYGVVPGETD